jgi:hypothetical protein
LLSPLLFVITFLNPTKLTGDPIPTTTPRMRSRSTWVTLFTLSSTIPLYGLCVFSGRLLLLFSSGQLRGLVRVSGRAVTCSDRASVSFMLRALLRTFLLVPKRGYDKLFTLLLSSRLDWGRRTSGLRWEGVLGSVSWCVEGDDML